MLSFEIREYMYYTRLKDILFWRGGSHVSPHLDSSNGWLRKIIVKSFPWDAKGRGGRHLQVKSSERLANPRLAIKFPLRISVYNTPYESKAISTHQDITSQALESRWPSRPMSACHIPISIPTYIRSLVLVLPRRRVTYCRFYWPFLSTPISQTVSFI